MSVKFKTHFVIFLFHCYSLLRIVTKSLKKKTPEQMEIFISCLYN